MKKPFASTLLIVIVSPDPENTTPILQIIIVIIIIVANPPNFGGPRLPGYMYNCPYMTASGYCSKTGK